MKIAVVGAGWAGLAAAVDLKAADHEVTVFEASHTPGGRARRVARTTTAMSDTQALLDNGQHILLGAYSETLDLMRRLGRNPDELLLRQPLQWGLTDGSMALKAPRLPAPFHALVALISARGLNLGDKWAAVRLMRHIKRGGDVKPAQTVAQWLDALAQPAHLTRMLWEPLCLAALNTPIETASAALFIKVLQDSLLGTRSDSDLLLPRTDLSALWPDAATRLVRMRYGQTIRAIAWGDDTVLLNGEAFDAAVLAIPPNAVARLIAPTARTPAAVSLLSQLRAFTYSPIATLVLQLDAPYTLPAPMMMLRANPARGHDGQWLFDRAALVQSAPPRGAAGELTLVVSAADALLQRDRTDTINQLIEQIRDQVPAAQPLPNVIASDLFIEKRATFAAVSGLVRPTNQTPWSRLVLAGDWTDTGYPGVLEGAIRSGRRAASLFRVRGG